MPGSVAGIVLFTDAAVVHLCASYGTASGNPSAGGQQWLGAPEQHVPRQRGAYAPCFDQSRRLAEHRQPPRCLAHVSRRRQPGLAPAVLPGGRRTPRPTNDWKNQILYPTDPFQSTNSAQSVTWLKFAILLNDPTRVYYQDSRKYLFHYDFATQRLPPFLGMDYATFDSVSLYRTNQQVVLGTVLYPPATTHAEYGVQFIGLDAYTPDEIGRWFELVKATIYASNSAEAYYMPTFEQSEVARTNADAFAALGIPVSSLDRWVSVNSCYSAGWAFGRLKFFAATDVVAAYGDGRLRPEDILLTDGVPADTPLVAGILTLSPSTPNSHTAILSQSFGIPFAYLPDPDEQARVQGLVGHKVILRATVTSGVAQIKVFDVQGQLDPALEAELLALKVPAPINFMPRQSYGSDLDVHRHSGPDGHPLLRRQGRQLRPAAALDSHQLPHRHCLLLRSVGRLSGPNPAGRRDAAGGNRLAPRALHELSARHRLAQDQPGRHP